MFRLGRVWESTWSKNVPWAFWAAMIIDQSIERRDKRNARIIQYLKLRQALGMPESF
jgi:cyanophycinase-like exopeptidase